MYGLPYYERGIRAMHSEVAPYINYVITLSVAECKWGTEYVHPYPVTRGKACSR